MTNVELAYFAGLIDGEGCLSIKRLVTLDCGRRSICYTPEIRIRMCNPIAMERFCNAFNVPLRLQRSDNLLPKNRRGTYKRVRQIYTAYQTSRKAYAIIEQLLPYLIVKRDEAQLLLDYKKHCIDTYNHLAVGSNRKPMPKRLVRLRHSYYLKLRRLKIRKYPTSRLVRRNSYARTGS